MEQPRISTQYLQWLHDFVGANSGDVTLLGDLPKPNEQPFIPMLLWRERLYAASKIVAMPDLGVRFGKTITPHRFGMLGYLLHHGESLGHVLLRAWHFRMLFFRLREITPEWLGDQLRLSWRFYELKPRYQEEAFAISACVQFARLVTGLELKPFRVGLVSLSSESDISLADFLECEIEYGQETTWMQLDTAFFALPTTQPDANLSALLAEQVGAMLAALPNDEPVVNVVRRHIIELMPQGEPTQEQVAKRMYMTTRTLHRQLGQCQQSFRHLLLETRQQLAEQYLRSSNYGIAEIALLLGYAQQSSFAHAFKRWTGLSPLKWQKMHTEKR